MYNKGCGLIIRPASIGCHGAKVLLKKKEARASMRGNMAPSILLLTSSITCTLAVWIVAVVNVDAQLRDLQAGFPVTVAVCRRARICKETIDGIAVARSPETILVMTYQKWQNINHTNTIRMNYIADGVVYSYNPQCGTGQVITTQATSKGFNVVYLR